MVTRTVCYRTVKPWTQHPVSKVNPFGSVTTSLGGLNFRRCHLGTDSKCTVFFLFLMAFEYQQQVIISFSTELHFKSSAPLTSLVHVFIFPDAHRSNNIWTMKSGNKSLFCARPKVTLITAAVRWWNEQFLLQDPPDDRVKQPVWDIIIRLYFQLCR